MSVSKVSIISVVLNDVRLSRAIDSVLSQNVDCEVEIIVVSDETDEAMDAVLREYAEHITVIRNDVRGGMYPARNQGILAASGDVVGFLNADDHYHDDRVLADAVNAFRARDDLELLSGNWKLATLSGEFQEQIYKETNPAEHDWLTGGLPFSDCALFHRRDVFDRYGNYEGSFRIAGDLDLMLRMSFAGASYTHLDRFVTVFHEGGMSTSHSVRMRVLGCLEMWRAFLRNGLPPVAVTLYIGLITARYLVRRIFPSFANRRSGGTVSRLIQSTLKQLRAWRI